MRGGVPRNTGRPLCGAAGTAGTAAAAPPRAASGQWWEQVCDPGRHWPEGGRGTWQAARGLAAARGWGRRRGSRRAARGPRGSGGGGSGGGPGAASAPRVLFPEGAAVRAGPAAGAPGTRIVRGGRLCFSFLLKEKRGSGAAPAAALAPSSGQMACSGRCYRCSEASLPAGRDGLSSSPKSVLRSKSERDDLSSAGSGTKLETPDTRNRDFLPPVSRSHGCRQPTVGQQGAESSLSCSSPDHCEPRNQTTRLHPTSCTETLPETKENACFPSASISLLKTLKQVIIW